MKWIEGRLNRRDYIVSQLVGSLMVWPLLMIERAADNEQFILSYNLLVLLPLIILVLGITVRRLHDINRSGWYALINLIPFLAVVLQIYLMLAKGNPLENQYGKTPTAELDLVHIFSTARTC